MSDITDKIWSKANSFLAPLHVSNGGVDKDGIDNLEILINSLNKRPIKILEVGSWTGLSACALGTIANKYEGDLTIVDWFKGNPNSHLYDEARYNNIRNICEDNLKYCEVNNVTIMEMTSLEASKKFKDFTFDLIFLDGDHRYEGVKNDIQIWLPKVKPTGILCGHDCDILFNSLDELYAKTIEKDCCHFHLGVTRAVNELLPKVKLIESAKIWYCIKEY